KVQKSVHIFESHGIRAVPSEHTGSVLDPRTKVASIGRHCLTTHGFAVNVTEEPLAWLDRVVACGLTNVRAGCIAKAAIPTSPVTVAGELPALISSFARVFERELVELDVEADGEVQEAVRTAEREALEAGPWPRIPAP
ncbi:hypothetical protein K466DRAFT_542285, partial [Polyporus arcularius HHB13444]